METIKSNKRSDKKILHIVIFGNERSIHVRRWTLGLRGLGHKVSLITLHKDHENDIGGLSLEAGNKISYLLKIKALKKIVSQLNPDIIHAHFASSYGFLSSYLSHPRKVLSVWGEDIILFPQKSIINMWMFKRTILGYNRITATSEFLKDILSKFTFQMPPVSVIAFGVDTELFGYFNRPCRSEIKIGIAKHLFPMYGVDTLIKAFYQIEKKYENIKLLIGGAGPEERRYRRLVSQLDLDEKTVFLGHINHQDMPGFYNSIDIATMPSRSDAESFGVAAIEASATGLPVVATRIGGIPEVVLHGMTGYLAGVDNIDQIAGYLSELIERPELRKQMGLVGRRMVENQYEWKHNLIEMQDLYYELMNK